MSDFIGLLLLVLLAYFVGACSHESDIARNCAETGRAGAFFHEIECRPLEDQGHGYIDKQGEG